MSQQQQSPDLFVVLADAMRDAKRPDQERSTAMLALLAAAALKQGSLPLTMKETAAGYALVAGLCDKLDTATAERKAAEPKPPEPQGKLARAARRAAERAAAKAAAKQ